METGEHIIFPPEGDAEGRILESGYVDVEQLQKYIESTVFEDEATLVQELSDRYHMKQRESFSELKTFEARMIKIPTKDQMEKILRGEDPGENLDSGPVSGEEPEVVAVMDVTMKNEDQHRLQIFKVFKNAKTHLEYVLKKVG